MTLLSKGKPLSQVISEIEQKSPFLFVYNTDEIDQGITVQRNYYSLTLEAILVDIFSEHLEVGELLKIRQVGYHILLYKEKDRQYARRKELGASISGKVYDAESLESLPGASFILEGTNAGVSSDLKGEFAIQKVKAGPARIIVSYIGFEKVDTVVNLTKGKNHFYIGLRKGLKLGSITVTGSSGGQLKALNQQLTSDGIRNIVSSDLIGRFPDMNVAEALQRVSGVNISRDRGEGSTVQLRGTPSNYVVVTINGEPIPSSQGNGERFEQLDILPVSQISSMEVIKSVTPEMSGNAIAGIINLVPMLARYPSPVFKADIGAGYASLSTRMPSLVNFSYSQRYFVDNTFKDGRMGLVAGASFYNTSNTRDGIEIYSWKYIETGAADNPYKAWVIGDNDLKYVDLAANRLRSGLFATIDYKLSPGSQLFLNIMYSQRHDDDIRNRTRFRFSRGTFIAPDTIRKGRLRRDINIRNTQKEIFTVSISGKSQLNDFGLNYQLFYSGSWMEEHSDISVFERRNIELAIHNLYGDYPYITAIGLGRDIHDPTLLTDYKYYYNNNVFVNGGNFSGKVDLSQVYYFNTVRGVFNAGLRYSQQVNSRNANNNSYNIFLPNEEDLFISLMKNHEPKNFLNGKVRFGPSLDKNKIRQFVKNNLRNFDKNIENSQFNDESYFYYAKESVLSGYLMGKIKISNYLLLGGVRMEQTNATYQAQVTEYGKIPSLREEQERYLFFLPNLQLKINFTEREVLRLAYTTGYVRPNYTEVVPAVYAESGHNIIHLGNPSLNPSYTNSFDIMFEKFFLKPGLFSFGFFYKSIADFHYQVMLPYNESLLPTYLSGRFDEEWSILRSLNGEKASVWGIETNYQSNFNTLPGWWKNFGVYFNYTYTASKAETANGASMELPGQAPHTMNMALTYKKKRLEGRVSLNYNGKFIYRAGIDSNSDIYQDQRWQLDLNSTYRINKNITLFAEFINITNSKQVLFWGNRSRIYQLDTFGWWSRAGLSFRF